MPVSRAENDRRTNIDMLESNKAANKEEIRRLREENKELRQKAAHLSRVSLPPPFTLCAALLLAHL